MRMWRSSKVAEVVEVKAMEGKQGSGCTKVTVRFKGSKAHGQGLEAGQCGCFWRGEESDLEVDIPPCADAFISARGPKSFYLSRLFWHPFSASSAPNDDGLVTFHAKTAGPFTNALQEAVSSRDPESQDAPLSLGVDGFHGRLRTDLTHSTHVVLVAGGIGLAPLLSIARDVANKMSTPLDLDGPTLAYSTRKVTLIWYTRTAEEFGWFEEEWKELEDANARLEKGGYRVELKAFVTRDEAPAGMNTCHVGKPDIAVVLEGLVKNERTSVAVCGPAGLVRDTRQGCAALIGKGLDVDAHWEVFEL